ncbi:hypothetical protein PR048_008422, partial [Dryococelus australis]
MKEPQQRAVGFDRCADHNTRLPPKRTGFHTGGVTPGFSHVGIANDAAGRRVFSGISRSPPLHSSAAPFSPHFTLIGSRDLIPNIHDDCRFLKGYHPVVLSMISGKHWRYGSERTIKPTAVVDVRLVPASTPLAAGARGRGVLSGIAEADKRGTNSIDGPGRREARRPQRIDRRSACIIHTQCLTGEVRAGVTSPLCVGGRCACGGVLVGGGGGHGCRLPGGLVPSSIMHNTAGQATRPSGASVAHPVPSADFWNSSYGVSGCEHPRRPLSIQYAPRTFCIHVPPAEQKKSSGGEVVGKRADHYNGSALADPSLTQCAVQMCCLVTLGQGTATVAERLAFSPPTKAIRIQYPAGSPRNFAYGNLAERYRWSEGFFGDLPFPSPFHSAAASYSTSITLIGSQDLDCCEEPSRSDQRDYVGSEVCRSLKVWRLDDLESWVGGDSEATSGDESDQWETTLWQVGPKKLAEPSKTPNVPNFDVFLSHRGHFLDSSEKYLECSEKLADLLADGLRVAARLEQAGQMGARRNICRDCCPVIKYVMSERGNGATDVRLFRYRLKIKAETSQPLNKRRTSYESDGPARPMSISEGAIRATLTRTPSASSLLRVRPWRQRTKHLCSKPYEGEPASIFDGMAPGFSHVGIVPDDAAGLRVFSGISHVRPFIPALLHIPTSLHHSSTPKTWMLRAVQISSLAHSTPASAPSVRGEAFVARAGMPCYPRDSRFVGSPGNMCAPLETANTSRLGRVSPRAKITSTFTRLSHPPCAFTSRPAPVQTNDEVDRSRWLRTASLRAPTLNCSPANTSSENGTLGRERLTDKLITKLRLTPMPCPEFEPRASRTPDRWRTNLLRHGRGRPKMAQNCRAPSREMFGTCRLEKGGLLGALVACGNGDWPKSARAWEVEHKPARREGNDTPLPVDHTHSPVLLYGVSLSCNSPGQATPVRGKVSTRDEVDRYRCLCTASLRVPIMNRFSANTSRLVDPEKLIFLHLSRRKVVTAITFPGTSWIAENVLDGTYLTYKYHVRASEVGVMKNLQFGVSCNLKQQSKSNGVFRCIRPVFLATNPTVLRYMFKECHLGALKIFGSYQEPRVDFGGVSLLSNGIIWLSTSPAAAFIKCGVPYFTAGDSIRPARLLKLRRASKGQQLRVWRIGRGDLMRQACDDRSNKQAERRVAATVTSDNE